jgi:hypothetical protein
MHSVFSTAAASMVAFSTLTNAAFAQELNSIYGAPFYQGQQFCQFTLPDELDVFEAERRFENNESLHPHLSAYFNGIQSNSLTHTYLWFQQENLPQIITGDDYIQVYSNIDNLVGNRLSVDRLEREDETFTILDSAFNGSIVNIDLASAEITVTLSDGRSETSSFDEIGPSIDGKDNSVMRFEDLGLIAYPAPTARDRRIIIAVDEESEHKDALIGVREQYRIHLHDNGYISAELFSHIGYTNPLLETSEEFANLFPPMMLCNSEWQRTSLTSLTPHNQTNNQIDDALGIELGRP